MKTLLILTITSALFTLKSQAQITATSSINNEMAGYTCREIRNRAMELVLKAWENRGLEPYADSNFSTKISAADFGKYIGTYERQQIINPLRPDDPYDLLDTSILTLYPVFVWNIHVSQKGFTQFQNPKKSIFYLKTSAFKKLVPREFLPVLAIFPVTNINNPEHMTFYSFDYFNRLQLKLYKSTNSSGNLKPYRDAALTVSLSKEELSGMPASMILWQMINPLNPNDPYDLIDTTIFVPMDSSKITGLAISGIFNSAPENSSISRISVAVLYSPITNGVQLGPRGLFWISWKDAKEVLSKEELEFLVHISDLYTINKMENGHMGTF